MGCFEDKLGPERDLPDNMLKNNNMTIADCNFHCQSYKYFGVEVM